MLALAKLMLKNIGRNKARTAVTACAVVVLVGLTAQMLAVLGSVRNHLDAEGSKSKLVVTERWAWPSHVPIRYVSELARLPGVTDWTTWNLYVGHFDAAGTSQAEAWGLATRPENLREMHLGLERMHAEVVEALRRQRTGAIVSAALLERMHWHVGDPFTVSSVSHPGKDLRFQIVGAMPPGEFPHVFFFRQDYFEEATGQRDTVSSVWLRLTGPEAARETAARVDEDFGRRQPELKVETESAGVARFVGRNQSLLSVMHGIVAVLLVDMVILLANSIGVATRQRRTEMAVLKALGMRRGDVLGLVVGEAAAVGMASGALGAGLAWLASILAAHGLLPGAALARVLLSFPVPATALLWGAALGTLVGAAGSVLPAWSVCRLRVAEVFAKVA